MLEIIIKLYCIVVYYVFKIHIHHKLCIELHTFWCQCTYANYLLMFTYHIIFY